ncbi:hypothetical protein ACFZC5_34420 [Nocardia gamkensis]
MFQTLRDKLGCKEIWVLGAEKWRNPDDDLPTRLRGQSDRELRQAPQTP